MAEKKRTHVEISVEEQLLIVKGYVKNRCNWPSVYADVKQAIDRLPEKCQALYKDGPFEKVKRRMSDQITKLSSKDPLSIQNEELRQFIAEIRTYDRRYTKKGHPNEKKLKAKHQKVIFYV